MLTFKNFLLETPQSISDVDFGLNDPNQNRSFFEELMRNKRKKEVASYDDGKAILYQLGYKLILVNKIDMKVEYFVQYKIEYYKTLESRACTQIKVWRKSPSIYAKDLAKDIFFNNLLKIEGIMMTDIQQTDAGKRFWENRISEAFSQKLFVYYVDFNSKKLENLENYNEFVRFMNEKTVYGFTHANQAKRLIISERQLKTK